jgi:hypothetical protein
MFAPPVVLRWHGDIRVVCEEAEVRFFVPLLSGKKWGKKAFGTATPHLFIVGVL